MDRGVGLRQRFIMVSTPEDETLLATFRHTTYLSILLCTLQSLAEASVEPIGLASRLSWGGVGVELSKQWSKSRINQPDIKA